MTIHVKVKGYKIKRDEGKYLQILRIKYKVSMFFSDLYCYVIIGQ